MTMHAESIVYVVDDQPDVLSILGRMASSSGFHTLTCASARSFLNQYRSDRPGCLVLDLRMPEMTGTQLQAELTERGWWLPVIVVTGYAELSECIKAVQQGVYEILHKPVQRERLVECIRHAVEHDVTARRVRAVYGELTTRERDVTEKLLAGYDLKQIAAALGIGFATAAKHRSKALRKFGVHNDVELVRLVTLASTPIDRRSNSSAIPTPHLPLRRTATFATHDAT